MTTVRALSGFFLSLMACSGAAPSVHPPAKSTMSTPSSTPKPPATFRDDLAFLDAHGKTIVLTHPNGGKVALSARYQGRVMTSALSEESPSLGWINRPFIEAGKTGTQFDNFGGEDRFWLGPEGGQYGLYFPPGKPFTFDTWQTPHALQEGEWLVADQKPDQVTFKKSMTVTNWSGTPFELDVERTVRLLGSADFAKAFGFDFDQTTVYSDHVDFVAYESKNRIVNTGKTPWTKEKGLLSVWILSMFAPSPDAYVIIPFETDLPAGNKIVNDTYFGKVPPSRLEVHENEGFLRFKCDGKERGKIGLGPERAKNRLGSYSEQAGLLTVVTYDTRKVGAPYVNSMWEQQKAPYAGDAINSYNDGSPGPGKPPLGGFYEIETSSPGAELAPGGSLTHTQQTFHFQGSSEYVRKLGAHLLLGKPNGYLHME